jgi:hypothetical protein
MRIAATALALAASLSLAGCFHTQNSYCRTHPGVCALAGAVVVGGVILVASRNQQQIVSDARLKHDVEYLTTLDNGIRLYAYSYLGDEQRFVGVMAEDLLADARFADAVILGADGFYRVDYGKLGLGLYGADAMLQAGARAARLQGTTEEN